MESTQPSIPADLLTALAAVEDLPPIEEQPVMRFYACAPCSSGSIIR